MEKMKLKQLFFYKQPVYEQLGLRWWNWLSNFQGSIFFH